MSPVEKAPWNYTAPHHADPTESELDAAEKIAPHVRGIKKQILALLDRRGSLGITPEEFCTLEGALLNTARRRFTDLWKAGSIRPRSPDRYRTNERGNKTTVWVIGYDPEGARANRQRSRAELERENETLRARVAELEAEVAHHLDVRKNVGEIVADMEQDLTRGQMRLGL